MIDSFTRYKPNGGGGITCDGRHTSKLRNKNILRVCEYLKLGDELREDGLL
jgi:hypothetical protein